MKPKTVWAVAVGAVLGLILYEAVLADILAGVFAPAKTGGQ